MASAVARELLDKFPKGIPPTPFNSQLYGKWYARALGEARESEAEFKRKPRYSTEFEGVQQARKVRQDLRIRAIQNRLKTLSDNTEKQLAGLIARFRAGQITGAQVGAEMERILWPAWMEAGRLGKAATRLDLGAQLGKAELMALLDKFEREREFIAGFAKALDEGTSKWPPEVRAQAYLGGLVESYNNRWVANTAGETKWVRHALDSCETCIEEEARGWIQRTPEERVPRDGTTICRRNCQCELVAVGGAGSAPIMADAWNTNAALEYRAVQEDQAE